MRDEPIAIVGMGLRLPGADRPDAFWRVLREGRDEIGEAPADRGLGQARGGFVSDVAGFDWRAFRLSPREAKRMDPQHRLLLMAAWNALEDAGLPFDAVRNTRTSVFAGLNFSDFYQLLAAERRRIDEYTLLGGVAAFAANRISHFFGLKGESLTLNAACSSSLAAVHHACMSLRSGEADFALACGAELMLSAASTAMLAQTGVLSASGACRALDGRADGYLRGEGVAAIVLRRLADVPAGERVYAVIAGSALNHNGQNEWLMATSAEAQEEVIRNACARGGVDPMAISYVELHGSALPKGDVAEMRAVSAALGGSDRKGPCRVGSLTNNIGYLGAAGGIAGLIRSALEIHHGELVPTIHVESPPVGVSLEELNLALQLKHEAWPGAEEGPVFAGVLSTSLGGANAFVVLSSAERVESRREADGVMVLPVSGHTDGALRMRVLGIRELVERAGADRSALYGICYAAARRKTHLEKRVAMVGDSRDQLLAAMDAWLEGRETRLDGVAAEYAAGRDVNWAALYPKAGAWVDLLPYPFQTERFWPEWLRSDGDAAVEKPNAQENDRDLRPRLTATGDARREQMLLEHLRRTVCELLEMNSAEPIEPGRRLFELGLSSISIAQLRTRLAADLGVPLKITAFFEHGTLEALAHHLFELEQGGTAQATEEDWEAAMRKRVEGLSDAEAEAELRLKLKELEAMLA
ncbi:MAG TPA: beta-ketoacyl synthase N-terminal-like domain-containing protein [Terracidiphilus sp.]|nr:beta-ketoacyl synthase N-terminal-like domain-containing protein [Terracidiphilus sp.]